MSARTAALGATLLLGACSVLPGTREEPAQVPMPDAAHVIWLDHPAEHFTSALPLGNGTMGALVFGGVDRERIVLNEIGLWSGSVQDPDRADAHEYLPQIRKLLVEGRNLEAEALLSQHFTCAGAGSGQGNGAKLPYGCYQVLGNLRLEFGAGVPDLSTWTRDSGGSGLDVAPHTSETFRCTFTADAGLVGRARSLDFSAIDDTGEIVLNGEPLGRTEDWSRSYSFDVRGRLREGANELVVTVANVGGEGHMARQVTLGTGADDYRNQLDLRTGIVKTSCSREGVRTVRECFVSRPHELFAERIWCEKPGGLSLMLEPDRPRGRERADRAARPAADAGAAPGRCRAWTMPPASRSTPTAVQVRLRRQALLDRAGERSGDPRGGRDLEPPSSRSRRSSRARGRWSGPSCARRAAPTTARSTSTARSRSATDARTMRSSRRCRPTRAWSGWRRAATIRSSPPSTSTTAATS